MLHAVNVGDGLQADLPQDGADSFGRVRGSAPARGEDIPVLEGPLGVGLSGQTDRTDPGVELDRFAQVDQSYVVLQSAGVVLGVGEEHHRVDVEPALLGLCLDVVSPQHHSNLQSIAVNTVSGRDDPLLRDESPATEIFPVNKEGRHPGVESGHCLLPTYNLW